jgi:hypothetical protein
MVMSKTFRIVLTTFISNDNFKHGLVSPTPLNVPITA